jgi:hypothetical protein
MEFVITKFNYYLPFVNDAGEIEGLKREHISVEGAFISSIESPNQATRDLLGKIKVDRKNTKSIFYFYVGSKEEYKKLRVDEDSKYINTAINLRATDSNQNIKGEVYLSRSAFNELKALTSIVPNSNSYFRFETIVYGDRVKSEMPIEVELHSHTCGIEMSFPIQQSPIRQS